MDSSVETLFPNKPEMVSILFEDVPLSETVAEIKMADKNDAQIKSIMLSSDKVVTMDLNGNITDDANNNKIDQQQSDQVTIEMIPMRVVPEEGMKISLLQFILMKSFKVILNFLSLIFGLFSLSSKKALPSVSDPLLLQPASRLVSAIKSGQVKSEQLLQAYINRIKQVQPYLNAVVDERFGEALDEARSIDQMIADELAKGIAADSINSIRRKPLLGLPLTTKNSIGVEGMIMDTGSVLAKGQRADKDSEAIRRAKEAGAIVICITNTPELVIWMDSHNFVYGRTNNPYDLSRIPGGSSGGEGALIAAAGSLMGVGSDIGGSIRIPSFYCGLFGHATTPGVVPVTGMYPAPVKVWENHLSFGPICRYAPDLRLLLKTLTGPKSYELGLDQPASLNGLTIYYIEEMANPVANPVRDEIKEAMRKTLDHFRSKYCAKIEPIGYKKMYLSLTMWAAQLSSGDAYSMSEEAALRKGSINPFWELLKFIVTLSNHTLPVIALAIFDSILPGRGSTIHNKMLDKANQMRDHFTKILSPNSILICPTLPVPALKHRTTLFNAFDVAYTMFTNVMSFPSTHCPTGLSRDGLPIGFQIVTLPKCDNLSITMACEIEKLFGGWVPPS